MQDKLQQHWKNAAARERLLIIVMCLVVTCAAIVALLVRPAWRVVQSAPATLDALDARVLSMRAQAAQLRAGPSASDATVLPSAERDLAGPGATITESRDAAGTPQAAVIVTLKAVESGRLATWLARPEVQKQLQRLTLTRDPASGRVTGSVVLRTPS